MSDQFSAQTSVDVAVIGAGIAGIVCAQQLQQMGYRVVVIEKSRGLGGRIATRRLYGTCADHGLRYLEPQSDRVVSLIQTLRQQGMLHLWTDTVYELGLDHQLHLPSTQDHPPRYVASAGMTAIAKFLATDLTIWRQQRVQAIRQSSQNWQLSLESTAPEISSSSDEKLTSQAVVIAIPAPQALALLEPLAVDLISPKFLELLRTVEFAPCLSAIAGYSPQRQQELMQLNPIWQAISCPYDPDLAWIGLDSDKRPQSQQPIFVIQSSAAFAEKYVDSTDLPSVGHQLLNRAAKILVSWLDAPDWLQVHRWRYAFVRHPVQESCLVANTPLPLVCSGDWCGGRQLENALDSGLAAADEVNNRLRRLPVPKADCWNTLLKN